MINHPECGDGADEQKIYLAVQEPDEIEFLDETCPMCGRDDCYSIVHIRHEYAEANSWGGSGFVTLGTQTSRKDLPVKVVIPAPRFKKELFWVVKP